MVILYKDPKGEKIFDRGQSQGTLNATVIDDAKIEQINELEKHCLELESRLGKYEVIVASKLWTCDTSYCTSPPPLMSDYLLAKHVVF